jgi:L,D-transpeptidase YcbB
MRNRLTSSVLLASLFAGVPVQAQQAPAPTPPPVVRFAPPAMQTTPLPASAPQPIALPTLSPEQMAQLTQLLTDGGFTHGLRNQSLGRPLPTDNDGLVRAALDYARAVHSGRLAEADFKEDWGLRPTAYDPLPDFAGAVQANRLGRWFAMLAPGYAGYDGLQKGLATYRAIEKAGGWSQVPAGPDLSVGATGPRVRALRKRLAVEDKTVVATGDRFDAELKAAVQRAQRRYGLNPTGTVSTGTLAALNVPAGARVKQIMANMERWRWLPAELAQKRIQVNIAAAVLTVFDGDQPIMSMKGVTGRPGDETPMLQSAIHSVVVNPPWNVPTGIAQRELWPKGPAYLARNGFKVIGTGPSKRLQQQAGPLSALGRFKFDFDNKYAVYLHDTPAQAKFASFDRLASHGCVRVEKPADLAELLLRDDPQWNAATLQEAVDGGKTQRVKLPEQVSVYLLYWTAFASANGTMNFRADPYSWDAELADKIEKRSAIQAEVIAE